MLTNANQLSSKDQDRQGRAHKDQSQGQTYGQKTLLIVDDSAADRAAFRRFLGRDNSAYQILEVESAEAGLSLLAKSAVDLILLDYSLPGIDGMDFLRSVKRGALRDIPVLMLTGQGDEQVAAKAIKAGAQDYIVKRQMMADVLQLAVRTALREAALESSVAKYQAQQSLTQAIALRIRQSLDLAAILGQAAVEVRDLLACDRVVIYRFAPNRSGTVEVESVGDNWSAIQGISVNDSCFENGWIDTYLGGQTTVIADIEDSDLTSCHIKMLSQFQVRANLVVPIVIATPSTLDNSPLQIGDRTLWGLLIAHQCDGPRQWQSSEIQLLQQLSDQLAIAIQQSMLYQQLQTANQQLEAKVEARTAALQQANTDLQQLNQALKLSNQELEQFAYIASHDLREPLRKIKSFAELLAKRYQSELDETGDRYINYITSGAVRMQALINDLLAYSRLGKRELIRQEADFNQVLVQALNTLSEQTEKTQAVIKAEPLPTLSVEALQIEQLFRNLIENALKYSRDRPPKIEITATRLSEEATLFWKFSVIDNGIGIDAAYYDRIFAIFQRLHSRNEYSGTGIGLAICQKIVERHGGEIGVESVLDEGSTFWFTLPA